jgi:hypothetical protein
MTRHAVRLDDGFGGRGDDFYEALIGAHEGLSDAQSHALNARVALILANHIGELAVLRDALVRARHSLERD